MAHPEGAAELRVLEPEGVVRMRVRGHDLLELRRAEDGQVLLHQELVEPLLAHPAHVVARVPLAVIEDAEVESQPLEDPRHRARQLLEARVVGGVIPHEPEILHRLLAGVLDLKGKPLGPAPA